MTIDGVNYRVPFGKVGDLLWKNQNFRIKSEKTNYNYNTGEVKEIKEKSYNGIVTIKKIKDCYKLSVKHQHLYNYETSGISHNASFFSIENSISSIIILQKLFELSDSDIKQIEIESLEINTKIIVDDAFYFLHKIYGVKWRKLNEKNQDFLYKWLEGYSYNDKFYHKGGQYPELCNPNTISIERKINTSRDIRTRLKCESMLDLKNKFKYNHFRNEIDRLLKDTLILNPDLKFPKDFSEAEKHKYLNNYSNPLLWVKENVTDKNKNYLTDRLKIYNRIQNEIGFNIHDYFTKLVNEAMTLQMGVNVKNLENTRYNDTGKIQKTDLRDNEVEKDNSINISSNPSNPNQSNNSNQSNNPDINNSLNSVVVNHSIPSNINLVGGGGVGSDSDSVNACSKSNITNCAVTGVSLKLECEDKPDAIYIQTKTLRYLFENNPAKYQQIKHAFIKNSIHKPKFEKNEFSHIAKQIRNAHYNKFRYITRAGVNQIPLF